MYKKFDKLVSYGILPLMMIIFIIILTLQVMVL